MKNNLPERAKEMINGKQDYDWRAGYLSIDYAVNSLFNTVTELQKEVEELNRQNRIHAPVVNLDNPKLNCTKCGHMHETEEFKFCLCCNETYGLKPESQSECTCSQPDKVHTCGKYFAYRNPLPSSELREMLGELLLGNLGRYIPDYEYAKKLCYLTADKILKLIGRGV